MERIDIYINKTLIIIQTIFWILLLCAGLYFIHTPGGDILVEILSTLVILVSICLLFKQLVDTFLQRKPRITITSTQIAFLDGRDWKEIDWSSVRCLDFVKIISDGKSRSVIKLDLIDGYAQEVSLDDLNYDWDEMQIRVKELKRDFDRSQNYELSEQERQEMIRIVKHSDKEGVKNRIILLCFILFIVGILFWNYIH